MADLDLSPSALSPAPLLAAVENYRGTIHDFDANRSVPSEEFARWRQSLVARFRRQGLSAGDRVILMLPNSPTFVAAFAAILACEASPMLLQWQTPAAEVERYARRFGVRYLIAMPDADPVRASLERLSYDWEVAPGFGIHFSLLHASEVEPRGPLLRGVPLHPTSGTTGPPKIALRPGMAAMEDARHYAETMQVGATDLIAAIPAMTHAYGYSIGILLALYANASVVTMPRFNAKQVQALMQAHPVSILPVSPAMLDVLLFGGDFPTTRLRYALAAGAVLPRRSAERFKQRFGVTVCSLMGTTETGGITVSTTPELVNVDGCLGPPMHSIQARVGEVPAEPEGGASWGPGIGILQVKTSSLMAGYLDESGDVTLPLDDGWFATGDLANIDADETIRLHGRLSEVVNVAGYKVIPHEVEEVIASLPGVREVKVYGAAQRTGGQSIKAAVAVDTTLSESEIRDFCTRQLVYYKVPRQIHIVPELPRSPNGKIQRELLP